MDVQEALFRKNPLRRGVIFHGSYM